MSGPQKEGTPNGVDRLAQIEAECHRRVSDRELRPQLRGEARDVLVLVEIAKAARVVYETGALVIEEEFENLGSALAGLDSGAAE